MVPFHSRGGSGREAGLTRLDDSDNRLVYGGRHTVLLAKTRYRDDDGVDLASATGVVVEQHRGTRVRDLAAERLDVLDRVADIHLPADCRSDGNGFLGAAEGDTPGIGIGHHFTDGQSRRACGA